MASSDYPALRSIYSGVWVPTITPFKDGEVDYDTTAVLARHFVDTGIHGLVICGTTGEGPALSVHEKAGLLDIVTTSVAGHIPIFMGLEGANTAQIISEIKEIGDWPIDGYLLSAPSYVRPNQEGIYRHFMAIADAAKKPIMIYDIPARTGVTISIETIRRLLENGAFPAIKACGLSSERLQDLVETANLKVLCGDDLWMYRALEMGAEGVIATTAQVLPDRLIEAYSLLKKCGAQAAFKRFNALVPLIQHMFGEPNPAPVKAALASQGWCRDELRLPMVPVTPRFREEIDSLLRDMRGLDHEALIGAAEPSN